MGTMPDKYTSRTSSPPYPQFPPAPQDSCELPVPVAPLSPTELVSLVCSFIRSDDFHHSSKDLIISPISPTAWKGFCEELEKPTLLSGKEVDSLRYDYCPRTATLTIPHMPTPVHDAVASFMPELIDEMIFSRFLSHDERRAIHLDFGRDVSLPTSEDLPLGICKGVKEVGTAIKQADAAIYFLNRQDPGRSGRFPRVVFEVAFSQSYSTLKEDARHWLVRSRGLVKLVVAVFLQEGPRGLSHARGGGMPSRIGNKGPGDKYPAPENTNQDDLDLEESETNSPTDSPQCLTAFDQQERLNDDPGPWVGPITGFIELYRYNSEERIMYQDGPRYDINPPSGAEEVLPRILITDLLPQAHIEGDKSRTFPLPLETYRLHIEIGIRNLAINRRSRDRKQKRRDNSTDGEYLTGSADEEREEGSAAGKKGE